MLSLQSYQNSKSLHKPDITKQTKARGVSTFQQKLINWSTLNLGNVHLTHICAATSKSDLDNIQKIPQTIPVVYSANLKSPMFGNGVFHAPKNKVAPSIDTR